ncbi:MAG: Nucleoside triphosphate pyrophosphohydrolase [Chlamydiae bacterium]|nr:Nucleoside triphosphate pyrophosphohydrolase [Chlamydiota bacterium]
MHGFSELIEIADTLNQSEGGCPWDLVQTFETLRPYILEEAHEALEAIDSGKDEYIIEELGDLFYTVIFYAKVAEREKRFSMKHIIERLKAKLIRRHPHVFGEKKAASMEEVIHNWEKIKKEEKLDRKSALDGIPKTLPSLQRAYKVLRRMKKKKYSAPKQEEKTRADALARQIYDIVQMAAEEEIDIESAFRTLLAKEEQSFMSWELNSTQP